MRSLVANDSKAAEETCTRDTFEDTRVQQFLFPYFLSKGGS
jgi:hypothetical protein